MSPLKSLSLILAFITLSQPVTAEQHSAVQAVDYRQALMGVFKWNVGLMRPLLNGDDAYDPIHIVKYARELATAVNLDLLAGFPVGSASNDSAARAMIWSDWHDFSTGYEGLKTASANLLTTAATGNLKTVTPLFNQVTQACKNCHEKFRED